VTEGIYIKSLKEGFRLRGANNQGVCYNLRTSLSNGQNTTNFLVEDINENLYFDDPYLLFEDSTIYGCKVQLTRDEL
jgi:hypothetical protein